MNQSSKEEYIERLFSSIAPRYDLLNSVLSFNRHKYWRAFAVEKCRLSLGDRALDVCTGTLDLAIGLSEIVGPSGSVLGVDFCRPMLEIGQRKLAARGIQNVSVAEENVEHLSVPSNSFDAATIGFALRNVENVENTLVEMTRAVKPGGRVVSLELAQPQGAIFRHIYGLYSRLLPFIGGVLSGSKESYAYLPASVKRFYSREELAAIMAKVGLTDIEVYNLTAGIATVHVGIKG